MNKIEITVRVNLIHLKLIFFKNKKIYCSRLTALVFRGKKLNFSHWFFKKKKKTEQCDSGAWLHCSLNSGTMLHYSLKIPTSSNPAAGQQKLVGPAKQNQFCLLYQTLICVAASEPHSQPHYQTGSKYNKK